MPDAFETRLAFTQQLQRLTASQQSQQKCAQFALRYRELDEDLFSCILEELDRTSMNARVNILYFLETLCDASTGAGFDGYRSMIAREIRRIAAAVAPQGAAGRANIGPVRKVLSSLQEKGFIENPLDQADQAGFGEGDGAGDGEISKEEILRRMEEDRERHKRLRENIWVVAPSSSEAPNPEFEQAWEQTSDLNDDDLEVMRITQCT